MLQANTTMPPAKKLLDQIRELLDQIREKIRYKHSSLSTEKTYIAWIKQYIIFHDKRHPAEMGAIEVERFLSYGLIINLL